MNTIFKTGTFLLLFFSAQCINAQLLKRIQNKVKQKTEEKLTEKAEKNADEILDAMLGNNKEKTTTKATNYTFNQSITIELQADSNEKATLDFLFNSKDTNVVCMTLDSASMSGGDAMEGQVYTVMTSKSTTMFMDMPGMKMKKKVSNDELGKFDNSDKVPGKDDLKKTGNTKTILGYTCHEYLYRNDGGTVRVWVTKDNFPIKNKFIPILGMKPQGPIKGFVMELSFQTKNGNGHVKVTKIDLNKSLKIDASKYKSMF